MPTEVQSGIRPIWKIYVEDSDDWIEREGGYNFTREHPTRIKFTIPLNYPSAVLDLSQSLAEPIQFLYVLHTSRGEGPLGRYQSPPLSRSEADDFLKRFSAFLVGDGRHDLWIRSATSGDFIVWDRHNDVYVYGDLEAASGRLAEMGFAPGAVPAIGRHQHHYRAEFDADARAILQVWAWRRTALQLKDEQYVAPVANDD
jgi:hypothetical protein